MTRFMAAAYALALALSWTTAPAQPMPEMDVTVVAEAATPEAAIEAAWSRADTVLDHKCQKLGIGGAHTDGGTEQVAPTATGFSAKVWASGTCR
ncbi:MAG: hypothetical protein H6737_09525 [Alphaproteobacteria bacterium]|nr:hypothetical protein [Alphaproteobacteria bacterium]